LWYHFTLTVPAGTLEASPEEKRLKLTYGCITHLSVGFPKGCKQLVKVRIFDNGHQLFPANPDEPASWDGGIEGGDEHYLLTSPPHVLRAVAYSPNATKAHDITVFVNLLPVEVAEPWREQISLLDRIKNVFGLG
jgi:hypothetical protein